MPADIDKIRLLRKAAREKATTLEERQTLALEQIADSLEALRLDVADAQPHVLRALGIANKRG